MTRLSREIEIDAPPADVYAVLCDPRCLREWVTIQEGLDEAPEGDLRKGSKIVQRMKVAGQRFKVSWTVKEAKRPERVVWEGVGPLGTKAKAIYELKPSNGGSKFSYVNDYTLPGGIAGKVAGRALSGASGREADRSLAKLKKFVERR